CTLQRWRPSSLRPGSVFCRVAFMNGRGMATLAKRGINAVPITVRRWTQLMGGLFGCALAIVLMIRSRLGLGPWDALHVGFHHLTGLTTGVISILIGVVILCGTWFMQVRPGVGTVVNMVMIGVFIDLLLP